MEGLLQLPNKASDSCTCMKRYNSGPIHLSQVEHLKQMNSDLHCDKIHKKYI